MQVKKLYRLFLNDVGVTKICRFRGNGRHMHKFPNVYCIYRKEIVLHLSVFYLFIYHCNVCVNALMNFFSLFFYFLPNTVHCLVV